MVASLPGPIPTSYVEAFGTHLCEEFQRQWKAYRKAVRRSRKDPSPPAVHGLRLASRRFLGVLEVVRLAVPELGVAKLRHRVRKLFKACADSRDIQVQLELLDRHTRQFPQAIAFRKLLKRQADKSAHRLRRALDEFELRPLKHLFKRSQASLLAECRGGDPNTHAVERVAQGMRRQVNKVRRRRGALDVKAPKTLHRFRIALKELRYSLEALQPFWDAEVQRRYEVLVEQLARLGDVQDLATLRDRLTRACLKLRPADASEVHPLLWFLDQAHQQSVAERVLESRWIGLEPSRAEPTLLLDSPFTPKGI